MSTPTCAKASAAQKRPLSADQRQVNDAHTFFKRIADGKVKKATPEQVEQCKAGLEMFKGLSKSEKMEFAKRVEDTKATKAFGWVKEFKTSLNVTKTELHKSKENYYTRTSNFMGFSDEACEVNRSEPAKLN